MVPMIKFCKLLEGKTGYLERHFDPVDISEFRDQDDKVIWVDIEDPTPADMAMLEEEFNFHRLALEDCLHSHQRPKVEQYEGFIFMVLYEARVDPDSQAMVTIEMELFLGKNFVVTVHDQPIPLIHEIERRWESVTNESDEGASYLAYLLIDGIVDTYFPVLDAFSDRLEQLEIQIFERFDPDVAEDIFTLKKETLELRRLVTPLRDVFLVLLRSRQGYFRDRTYVYFQDVLDHLLRISDGIDTYRELVGSALDAYMTAVSNRTNDTMKKLTVISTVLMSMALIAGIYGMNFRNMPELSWQQGYFFALYAMIAVAAILTGLFKWKKYI